MNKVEHLLKLADEYQAVSVLDLCVKCLKDERKSKQNVVKIIFLADSTVMAKEDDRLDGVREECNDLIKNIELSDILGKKDFKNLDRDSLENVFVQRTERLEKFLKRVYPQFIGLAEFCMFLGLESRSAINRCPEHYLSGSKANEGLFERIKSCTVCRKMILQLVSTSKESYGNKEHRFGGICHFDHQLISVIQDFKKIIKSDFDTINTLPTVRKPFGTGFQFTPPPKPFGS